MSLLTPLYAALLPAALLAVGVAVGPDVPRPAAPAGGSAATDLHLVAERQGTGPLVAGTDPWVSVALVNRSRTATHWVVQPGHGSEIGSREPRTSWSAEIVRPDGTFGPVNDRRGYGYCGTCLAAAADWGRDVVALGPGDWMAFGIPQQFEFQQAGRVRLRAHYEYTGPGRFAPDRIGPMAAVPPFKLTSNPVEFEVVRPLDVQVRVKRPLRAGERTCLSDVIAVRLVNQSGHPIRCSSPTLSADARLSLVFDGEGQAWFPTSAGQTTTYGVTYDLQPGEEVPLIGPGEFPNGMDGTWTYPKAGRVRVRAVYTSSTWTNGPTVRSDWAEVRVEE